METKSARKSSGPNSAAAKKRPARRRATPSAAAAPGLRLTHPERVYWEDIGLTKQGLAGYYASVWDWMAPHVVDRPLSLLRCPDGVSGECFFQRHIAAGIDAAHLIEIPDGAGRKLLAIANFDGLLALVQAGVLEIHAWGAKTDDLDTCDRIVFDLDPGPDVEWRSVIAAAREIRERLEAHRLESFVKTSGGKGLHVMLPVEGAGWDAAKDFAHEIALGMAGDKPGLFTASMAKSKRTGRIFVDYLRNTRGASSVAAFSTRARAGAPVSAPLSWDELAPQRTADSITVASMPRRLSRLHSDPWADLPRTRQRLPAPR